MHSENRGRYLPTTSDGLEFASEEARRYVRNGCCKLLLVIWCGSPRYDGFWRREKKKKKEEEEDGEKKMKKKEEGEDGEKKMKKKEEGEEEEEEQRQCFLMAISFGL